MSATRIAILSFAAILVIAATVAFSVAGETNADESGTELISVNSNGDQGDGNSKELAMTPDGQVIAFYSNATNLDFPTYHGGGIYIRDRSTGSTEYVYGAGPSITDDGRYLAFMSGSNSLVPNDTNGKTDIFVLDRQTDTFERVSVGASGQEANDNSRDPVISADGRYVLFRSYATNFGLGTEDECSDLNPPCYHAYLRDRQLGTTERIDQRDADGGVPANSATPDAITPDGRYIVFHSQSNQIDPNYCCGGVFRLDRQTGTTELVSLSNNGGTAAYPRGYGISDDGRYVLFESGGEVVPVDHNNNWDVFIRDVVSGTTVRQSVAADGTGADDWSWNPDMSGDGRYVAFSSKATNLILWGDTGGVFNIYVRDRDADEDGVFDEAGEVSLSLMTMSYDGGIGNGDSDYNHSNVSVADNGDVAFTSAATNLVSSDTNGYTDVFFRALGAGGPTPTPPAPSPTPEVTPTPTPTPSPTPSPTPTPTPASWDGVEFEVSVDADSTGNSATSLGTLDACRAVSVNDTFSVDIIVPEVPEPGVAGFQAAIAYDQSVLRLDSYDPDMMIVADPGAIDFDLSDQLPDTDGQFLFAFVDLSGSGETGEGVLVRLTFEAISTGSTVIDLDEDAGVILDTPAGQEYPLEYVRDAEVVVGGSCPGMVSDSDSDGFMDIAEDSLGTSVTHACALTSQPNDEATDAWPVDFDDSQSVTISDVLALKPVFNSSGSGIERYDLSPDGAITISDVLFMKPVFNTTCTP